MEEYMMLRSMLNILNSNTPKKKNIVEALPTLLMTYDELGEFDVFDLIVISAQNLCFQVFDSKLGLGYSSWTDSDVPSDNLRSLLTSLIDIIKKRSETDIDQLYLRGVELSSKLDFENCPVETVRNIAFCMQKLFISRFSEVVTDDCGTNRLRESLVRYVLNEPNLNRTKSDVVLVFLNGIVSVNYVPTLWQNVKTTIKTHPDRVINLVFHMQCLFFDPRCSSIVLNDDDFWSLLRSLLCYENNVIRTRNNIILKLSCSQLSSSSNQIMTRAWNDYVVVMETLENTQQHLTLPVLSTAKRLAGSVLPVEWIEAMYRKMFGHGSRHVVLAAVDLVCSTDALISKLTMQSFVESLNDVFLYKMDSATATDGLLEVSRPKMEVVLSSWFDRLLKSESGQLMFDTFLALVSTVKWSIVPLVFVTKSLANVSSSYQSPLFFDRAFNIKAIVEKMPSSYLKSAVSSLLFTFFSNLSGEANVNSELCCDLLFDSFSRQKHSWWYTINSVRKIKKLDRLDEQLSMRIGEKPIIHNLNSTCIGLFTLSDIYQEKHCSSPVSVKKLDSIFANPIDASDDLIKFMERLLEVESYYSGNGNHISQILDKHLWSLTVIWVEKCFETTERDSSYDKESVILSKFLDKIMFSSRIEISSSTKILVKNWFLKCISYMERCDDCCNNYFILAIYNWIGEFANRFFSELLNDWLFHMKRFIDHGHFSMKNRNFYVSRKHKIPLLNTVNMFFQYSADGTIVSEERMCDIFDWLMEKTVESSDDNWSVYFSTVKTFFGKFSIQSHPTKVIQFVENCWEFLIGCRVSCYPNATKSFIEMAFHYNLLSNEDYVQFVKNQIMRNLLTEKYRDKFSVCFSLLLLKFFERDQSANIIKILEIHQVTSEFLAKCLLFTIERYGAHKIEWDTIDYVRTLKDFPLIDDISIECLPDDRYLRFRTIKYLYKLNSNTLWKNVLNAITTTELSLRDRKFFHNSKAYRIKQRVVQILLIIACDKRNESLIAEKNIYKWSLTSLKEVSHIHSVAYQLIWLMVLIYTKHRGFSDFWIDLKNAQENHNYLCSFISIIYHSCRVKNDKQFDIECIKHLLPQCFSNGYKIRLYAQSTICRLILNNPDESEWSLLCKTMENVIAENEKSKKYENPFNDFFYRELHMIGSLTLKNVCIELPRLLNIVYEERFPLKLFIDFSAGTTNNDDKYDLSPCSVSSFIQKNTTSVLSNEISVLDNAQNAQRKYIPSQPMDEHSIDSMLIVVASLIDKVTNLGGLARTCQVFGASTLVVDSLSCVEKREFTALSMTAEKHQSIIEVKVKNLKSYLQKKKNEGYQIVAAEQTVDSVKLHNTELPFKCILLLGNETSGIPHDLLSVMDKCVEIEQLGIVRSLNVHVAGSLFIWEYTKQHCLKKLN